MQHTNTEAVLSRVMLLHHSAHNLATALATIPPEEVRHHGDLWELAEMVSATTYHLGELLFVDGTKPFVWYVELANWLADQDNSFHDIITRKGENE